MSGRGGAHEARLAVELGAHEEPPARGKSTRLAAAIRLLIATSDPAARALIAGVAGHRPDMLVVKSSPTGATVLEAIESKRADVVLLDLQTAGIDGLEVLGRLRPRSLPAIVVLAAKRDCAARAFEMGALDYVVRPFSRRRIIEAVTRAREHVVRERLYESAVRLLEQIAPPRRPDAGTGRIAVRAAGRLVYIALQDVDWIESEHNYARLHIGPNTYRVRKTIAELEAALPDGDIVRIHRRTLVRLSRIRELRLSGAWRCDAVLTSGVSLPVSRTYRAALRRRLERR